MKNRDKNINKILLAGLIIIVIGIVMIFSYTYSTRQESELNNSNNNSNINDGNDSTDNDSNTDDNNSNDNDSNTDDNNSNDNDSNTGDNNDNEEPEVIQTTFNSINELTNSENVKVGTTVQTEGFYQDSNRGGAYYEIVNTPSDTVDNILILKLQNNLYAEFSDKNTELSVEQTGAKGDGKTDDTKAIEALLNYEKANISIDTGKYLLSDNINVNEQNNKVINGNNSEFIMKNSSIININKSQDIVLENLQIKSEQEQYSFQINIMDSNNIYFNNNIIEITTNNELLNIENSSEIKMNDNDINYKYNGTNHVNVINGNVTKFSDNLLNVSGNSEKISIFNLSRNSILNNNEINIDVDTVSIFNNVGQISNNIVNINKPSDFLIENAQLLVNNNTIYINDKMNAIIKYDNMSLQNDIDFNNNNIVNNYDEKTNNQVSKLINISNTLLNNYELNVSDNTVTGNNINEMSYLFIFNAVESNQNIILDNNDIEGYSLRFTTNSRVDKITYKPKADKIVSSMNSMKTDTTLLAGDIVKTESYHEGSTIGGSYYEVINIYPSVIYRNNETVALANNLYAILVNTGNGVSVNQFGATGSGSQSDMQAISEAVYSGYDYIYFEEGTYRLDDPLVLSRISNLKIDGRNQIIYYDDNFDEVKNQDTFFIHSWESSNLDFVNLNIETRMTKSGGINNQIEFYRSENVSIKDSLFYIVKGAKATTNIDLNSQWKNFVIDNNELINLCDQNAGGNIWIRDMDLLESSGLEFTNNTVDKISHDEHLAVFLGTIKDVYIAGNSFTSTFGDSKTSVMAISFGTAYDTEISNIIFEDNYVNVIGVGALMYIKDNSDTIIRNNELIYTKELTQYNNSVINGDAELVENNHIIIKEPVGTGLLGDKLINGINVIGNTIDVEADAYSIFEYNQNVKDNIVNIKGDIIRIFYNVNGASNNQITVEGKMTDIIQYNEYFVIKDNILFSENVINYNYDEITNNVTSNFIHMDKIMLKNYDVNISNNTINANLANPNSYIYDIDIADTETQNINIFNNTITSGKYTQKVSTPSGLHNILLNQ